MTTAHQRELMGEAMDALVLHRAQVLYLQHRLMASRSIATLAELRLRLMNGPPLEIDCSESATLICHVSGLRDPNGNRTQFNGVGNTQMMYDHLPHYLNPEDAMVGALCWFGFNERLGTQHVTVVREPGPDPLLYSHGGHGAFQSHYIRLSVERRYHVGQPVFLSVAGL